MRNSILIVCVMLLMACSAPATLAPTAAAPTATPVYLAKLGTVERDITYCQTSGVDQARAGGRVRARRQLVGRQQIS
jgi:hypothetical protein